MRMVLRNVNQDTGLEVQIQYFEPIVSDEDGIYAQFVEAGGGEVQSLYWWQRRNKWQIGPGRPGDDYDFCEIFAE